MTDVDSYITSAAVTLSPYYANLDNVEYATSVPGISYIADTSVGGQYTLQFSGANTTENYQTVLRAITYSNNGPKNQDAERTFTYTVTDAEGRAWQRTPATSSSTFETLVS